MNWIVWLMSIILLYAGETANIDPDNIRTYEGLSDEATYRIEEYLGEHLQEGEHASTTEGFNVRGKLYGHDLLLKVRRDRDRTFEISIQGDDPSFVFSQFEEGSGASTFRKRE